MRSSYYLFLIILLTVAFSAQAERLKVGVIVPLTGPAASMGVSIRKALELSTQSEVEFIFEDDLCSAQKALAAYHKLTPQGVKVFYVACSGSLLALAPIVKKTGNLILTAYAGSAAIRDLGTEKIRFVPDAISVLEQMEEYFKENPQLKFGLLFEEQDYASSLAQKIKQRLADRIVVSESYLPATESYRSILLKFNSSKIDQLILIPVSDVAVQLIYKELRQLRIGKPLLGEVNLCDYAIKPQDYGLSGLCWKATLSTPGFATFDQKFKAKYGEPTQYPFYDAITYDVAEILANLVAVAKAQAKVVSPEYLKNEILLGQTGKVATYQFSSTGEVLASDYLQPYSFGVTALGRK
jgi:branched-chain amino acid transport system substrate-binding protein